MRRSAVRRTPKTWFRQRRFLLHSRDRPCGPSSRRRRSSPIERPRCCGLLALSRPLHFSHRVHQHDMWKFHRRCRKVELWRPADEQVWIGQRRRSDAGGNVGRPAVEPMCAGRRLLFEGDTRRQSLALAQDISLPRHCDYRPAAVVRLRGYKWLVDRCASMMLGLCLLRWPARGLSGQRPDSTYILMLPPWLGRDSWRLSESGMGKEIF